MVSHERGYICFVTTVQLTNGLASLVGETIREARIALDLNKADAARRAGLSRRTWHEVEEGQRTTTTVETLTQIEDVLGIEPGTLFALTGAPQIARIEQLRGRAVDIVKLMSGDELEVFVNSEGAETLRAKLLAEMADLRAQIEEVRREVVPPISPPRRRNPGDREPVR